MFAFWAAVVVGFGIILGIVDSFDLDRAAMERTKYCQRVAEHDRAVAAGERPTTHRDFMGVCK